MNEDQVFRALQAIRNAIRSLQDLTGETFDSHDVRYLDLRHEIENLDQILYSEPHTAHDRHIHRRNNS